MTARLDRARNDVDALLRDLPAIHGAFREWGRSGFASGGGEGGAPSSPPGIAASVVERVAGTPDEFEQYKQRFERRLAELNTILDDLVHCGRWALPAKPEHEPKWCEVMAQVGVNEPAMLSDVGGRLPEKHLLCRWARQFVERSGRLPTKAEAQHKAAGGKVKAVA